MKILITTCAFALFYVACTSLSSLKEKWQERYLVLFLCVFTFLIGTRVGWPDQGVYQIAFSEAPLPWEINWFGKIYGYAEHGYLLLASIVKLVYNSATFYFLAMGGLSMLLLYKGLKMYSAIPLLGLCDYVGRFLLNRDFQQMRSSLAILLLILAIKLIRDRKLVAYLLVVLLAYQFHHLSLIGIPLYFLYKVRIGPISIIFSLVMAMLLSH